MDMDTSYTRFLRSHFAFRSWSAGADVLTCRNVRVKQPVGPFVVGQSLSEMNLRFSKMLLFTDGWEGNLADYIKE